MTFYTYMIRTYKNECSNRGDLANDMARNKDNFPRNKSGKAKEWHEIILNYLFCHNACSECIETFEECWEEYLALEKTGGESPPWLLGRPVKRCRKAVSLKPLWLLRRRLPSHMKLASAIEASVVTGG